MTILKDKELREKINWKEIFHKANEGVDSKSVYKFFNAIIEMNKECADGNIILDLDELVTDLVKQRKLRVLKVILQNFFLKGMIL